MRVLLAVLALVPALALARPASAQPSEIEVSLALDRGAYEPGAVVGFAVRVRNPSPAPVSLTFLTAQRFDVVVRRGAIEISRWSQGRLFGQVVDQVRVAPGETALFVDSWLPLTGIAPGDLSGGVAQPLAPGLYDIRAELATTGVRPASPALTLVIGTPTPLPAGCSPVATTFGAALPADTVAATVDPPVSLGGMWRLDPVTNRYAGFSPRPRAPVELLTVNPFDTLIVCLAGPGRILMPGF